MFELMLEFSPNPWHVRKKSNLQSFSLVVFPRTFNFPLPTKIKVFFLKSCKKKSECVSLVLWLYYSLKHPLYSSQSATLYTFFMHFFNNVNKADLRIWPFLITYNTYKCDLNWMKFFKEPVPVQYLYLNLIFDYQYICCSFFELFRFFCFI